MTNITAIPYEEYFGAMPLTEEEKKRRIEFAKQMEELFIILFVLMRQNNEDYFDTSSVEQRLEDVLEDNNVTVTKTMATLIRERLEDIVAITQRHTEDTYYTSDDRAKLLAEEETNTFLNREEYDRAKSDGMTRKQWITMKDSKVRDTHERIDDAIIPIDEDFAVGGCMMAFPRDTKGDPNEIAGCRCGIKYLP